MIVPYKHEKHFSLLRRWNDARGQVGLEPWMLPDVGFVLDDKAMAFLVMTNSPVAWIAHWAVDPNLPREERDRAFDELSKKLENVARLRGYRLIQTLGKTGHNLSSTLRERGYVCAPGAFTFLVKDIRS